MNRTRLTTQAVVLVALVAGSTVTLAEPCGEGLPKDGRQLGCAIYTNCVACHGTEGQGGFAPRLATNENLKNTDYLVMHILKGSPVMPAFRNQLSSAEIAAIVNYVRNSWGNRAEKISAADVVRIEKQLAAAATTSKDAS